MEKDTENQYVRLPYWWWDNLCDFYIDYYYALERYDSYQSEDK